MELRYKKSLGLNALAILRKAGYSPFIDPKTGSESFVLRLTGGYYPRFHLYLNDKNGEIIFSLHLDQKKPGYKGGKMHNAEYDGPTVEKEMERIRKWIESSIGESKKQVAVDTPKKKKGLFGGIFG